MGEAKKDALRVSFDNKSKLKFHGVKVTSDAGLLAYREIDDAFRLTEMTACKLTDNRIGKNTQHSIVALLRQSVYSRLAGYEDTNDAERLSVDPAMRYVVGERAKEKTAASVHDSHVMRQRQPMHYATIVFLTFATLTMAARADRFATHTIDVDSSKQTYHVHKPDTVTEPLPLVVVLHGGGGNGKGLKDTYGFKPFINDGEFIAIYPDSGPGGWLPDHVAFLDSAIDDVMKRERIDGNRLYITGASRGGLMTFVATQKSKHKFAAAGTVISSNLQGLLDEYPLSVPLDFAMIAGTEDPLMPYNGGWGAMRQPKTKGEPGARVVPVEEMIAALARLNGITDRPAISSLGNSDKDDGCTNEVRLYSNRTTKRRVMLVKVIGGGHVVPGGRQYLPKTLIGSACSDFDHAAVMWDFFKSAGTGLPPKMVTEASRP